MFAAGTSPLDDNACVRIAGTAGRDAAAFRTALAAPATEAALAGTLADALADGVFGVPSFVAEARLFWGNDRLPLLRQMLRKTGTASR